MQLSKVALHLPLTNTSVQLSLSCRAQNELYGGGEGGTNHQPYKVGGMPPLPHTQLWVGETAWPARENCSPRLEVAVRKRPHGKHWPSWGEARGLLPLSYSAKQSRDGAISSTSFTELLSKACAGHPAFCAFTSA